MPPLELCMLSLVQHSFCMSLKSLRGLYKSNKKGAVFTTELHTAWKDTSDHSQIWKKMEVIACFPQGYAKQKTNKKNPSSDSLRASDSIFKYGNVGVWHQINCFQMILKILARLRPMLSLQDVFQAKPEPALQDWSSVLPALCISIRPLLIFRQSFEQRYISILSYLRFQGHAR